MLGHDAAVLAGIATLLAPAAHAAVLFSVLPRDGVPGPHAELEHVYARHGLELLEARGATIDEIRTSSWGKRLRDRPVTRLTLRSRA